MSVTSVTEVPARGVDVPAKDPLTSRREFVVVTTSVSDGEAAVVFANGVPRHNEQHPSLWSFCTGVAADRDTEQPLVWHVTASYKGISFEKHEQGQTEDGSEISRRLAEPTKIEIGTVHYQEEVYEDVLTGNQIENSAGDKFDPLITRISHYLSVTVSRYEYNPNWNVRVGQYLGRVNRDQFWGMGDGCLLFYDASGETLYDEQLGIFYWHATYTIHANPKGWGLNLADRGFYRIARYPDTGATSDGLPTRIRITDNAGNDTVIPSKLDGAGKVLGAGLPTHYLNFDIYERVSFSDFNFPYLNLQF